MGDGYKITQQLMYELRFVHGLSHKDIGDHIGLSKKTVDNYPRQALPSLENFLKMIKLKRVDDTMTMLCKIAGGVFVRSPEVRHSGAHILQQLSELSKDFGGTVEAVSNSITPQSDEGTNLSKREAREILLTLTPLILCAEEMVQHLTEIIDGEKHKNRGQKWM